MKNILAASILSADFLNLGNDIKACEKAGVDWIHIDVMDGHFVPNLTMGPFIVEACRKATSLPLDCHLMVENPEDLIESFARAGASNISIHPENNPLIRETLLEITALGCKAGIAINPSTPAEIILPLIPFADLILVMTVNPGYSGQVFMPEIAPKIVEISSIVKNGDKPIIIEVDGGINKETIKQTHKLGANAFVSASAIFHHPQSIAMGVAELRSMLD